MLRMQNLLNGVSMAVGVTEKALYSSYTLSIGISDQQLTLRPAIEIT